ncbi:primase-like DNA-binding domain-containing protein [Thermomicrobiaceae bacterium CFH 74404]|uniref:Primase-like DNA-binding domain-containing protein n=1 Tax=Thermalbibacter longus TaxID=2951981 RepID=A0AA41WH94_9BACT|nr:primase-like DNA-binding domain-containing protein [Thermalbibacter longus]MCM8750005.1 primase-like DNA-binding domain-containing protein [Thermalbibacter longus]
MSTRSNPATLIAQLGPEVALLAAFKDLYSDYKAWCEEQGEQPLGTRAFGNRLSERGFNPTLIAGKTKARAGIRLLSSTRDISMPPYAPNAPKSDYNGETYIDTTALYALEGASGALSGEPSAEHTSPNFGNGHDPPGDAARCRLCGLALLTEQSIAAGVCARCREATGVAP